MKLQCTRPPTDASHYIFTLVLSSTKKKLRPIRYYMLARIAPKTQGEKTTVEITPELVKTMTSYVPQYIVKDVQIDPAPRTSPYIASFPACILFIDVSGAFSRSTLHSVHLRSVAHQ